MEHAGDFLSHHLCSHGQLEQLYLLLSSSGRVPIAFHAAYSYDHMDLMRDCHMPCPSPPEHMQLLIREPACSCLLTMTPMGILLSAAA